MRHSFLARCLVVGCTKTAAKAPESSQPDSVPEPPAAPQVEVPPPTDPIVWLSSTATRLSAQVEDATDLVQKTDDIPKLIEGQFWRDHLTQAASALCDAQRTLAKPPLTIPEAQAPNLEALRAAASDVCALHGALDSVAKGERQGLARQNLAAEIADPLAVDRHQSFGDQRFRLTARAYARLGQPAIDALRLGIVVTAGPGHDVLSLQNQST